LADSIHDVELPPMFVYTTDDESIWAHEYMERHAQIKIGVHDLEQTTAHETNDYLPTNSIQFIAPLENDHDRACTACPVLTEPSFDFTSPNANVSLDVQICTQYRLNADQQ